MKGIELRINDLNLYFSKNSDVYETIINCLVEQELKLSKKSIKSVMNNFEEKINNCLSEEGYFFVEKNRLSRDKKIKFKEVTYNLNLSEHKHLYFYNLVYIYNTLDESSIDDKVKLIYK